MNEFSAPPPPRRDHPESHLDGCPECVIETALPHATTKHGDDFVCRYECPGCGHQWATSWKGR